MRFQIGLLLFPRLTRIDLTGPYEVFIQFPDTDVHLVSKSLDPVTADGGMRLLPSTTFSECPKLDLVCVPGGAGMNLLLNDRETLNFLNLQAAGARCVTSVYTGALALGAAGLLRGRRATTHWMSLPVLAAFECEPVAQRVVVDGNVITGGGVTAAIDFALTVAAELFGAETARRIQLGIEYAPHPPFDSGTPGQANVSVVAALREAGAARHKEREAAVEEASARVANRSVARLSSPLPSSRPPPRSARARRTRSFTRHRYSAAAGRPRQRAVGRPRNPV